MIVFSEPGEEFNLEKIKQKDNKVKIRVIFLFAIFLLLIILLAKSDFNFDFFKTKAVYLEPDCSGVEEFSHRNDRGANLQNAKLVLQNNLDSFETLEGSDNFAGADVVERPLGYQKRTIPIIELKFRGIVETSKKIPDELCGFKRTILYQ